MLTESGTHAIDLICRFLLQPVTRCWSTTRAISISTPRTHRVNIVSVYTPAGPDIEAFGCLA